MHAAGVDEATINAPLEEQVLNAPSLTIAHPHPLRLRIRLWRRSRRDAAMMAFDEPPSKEQVVAIVQGFIKDE